MPEKKMPCDSLRRQANAASSEDPCQHFLLLQAYLRCIESHLGSEGSYGDCSDLRLQRETSGEKVFWRISNAEKCKSIRKPSNLLQTVTVASVILIDKTRGYCAVLRNDQAVKN